MGKRALVAYATRAGSTVEIAAAIGEMLSEAGTAVDILPAKQVTDPAPYQLVVLGSGIYLGRWMRDAVKLLERHREALNDVPVAFFSVCLTLKEATEENRRKVAAYMEPVRERVPEVEPAEVGMFAGRLDASKLPLHHRLIIDGLGEESADYRDWDAVRAWGEKVASLLPGA
jgi:menaquinone-dependent protoporphyrinogen oxidase